MRTPENREEVKQANERASVQNPYPLLRRLSSDHKHLVAIGQAQRAGGGIRLVRKSH